MTKQQKQFDFTHFYKQYEHCYDYTTKPSQQFLEWFIGFAEGDGSLFVENSNKTLGHQSLLFEITLHSSDIHVLHYIKHNLHLGSVSIVKSTGTCRYRLATIKAISCLICLFNGNIVVPKFHKRFTLFLEKYNQKITNPLARQQTKLLPVIKLIKQLRQPTLFDAWSCGFTDAEGCFYATYDCKYNRWRYYYTIDQKGKDNSNVLMHFKQLWSAGIVKCTARADHWYFRVHNLEHNLNHILPYFKRYSLQTKKRISFEKWETILKAISNKNHKNPIVNDRLITLAKTINKI